MKTIEINLYKFEELSKEAQQTVVDNYAYVNTDFIYDEAYNTVKAFNEIFGTKEGRESWSECSTSHIDDDIAELKGLRLRKYIINNFGASIYKGKYFSLWSKTEKSYKYYKEGYPVLKKRHSKVTLESSCPFTGVYYDDVILEPIIKLIEYKDAAEHENKTFSELMGECFENLKESLNKEVEYQESDEGKREDIEANNEDDYTVDGETY